MEESELIKIDKGVPLSAPPTGPGSAKYPWRKMVVGDSFFVAGLRVGGGKSRSGNTKGFSTSGGKNMVPGSKWCSRTVTENGIRGVRVWRIA